MTWFGRSWKKYRVGINQIWYLRSMEKKPVYITDIIGEVVALLMQPYELRLIAG
jgi:hypothetical protein